MHPRSSFIPSESLTRKSEGICSGSVETYVARLEQAERASRFPERAQSAALCWLLEPDPQTADDGIRRSVR